MLDVHFLFAQIDIEQNHCVVEFVRLRQVHESRELATEFLFVVVREGRVAAIFRLFKHEREGVAQSIKVDAWSKRKLGHIDLQDTVAQVAES